MEGRQYAAGLKCDDWILPSPLDDTSLRSGVSVLRRDSSGFGLVLNLQLFSPQSVRFSLMKEGFLRVQAVDRGRRAGNKVFARKSDLCFPIPDYVKSKRLVIEWYRDDFVYVRERVCNRENDKVMIAAHVIDMGSPFPQTAPCSRGASLPPEDAPIVGIQPPVASSSEGFREDLTKTIRAFIQACASIAGESNAETSDKEISAREASSPLPTMQFSRSFPQRGSPKLRAALMGITGQHASTQTHTNEVLLPLNKGILPEVASHADPDHASNLFLQTGKSNVKDASAQAATDKHKVVFPLTDAPLETAVPSQGTDITWERYRKKVAHFKSADKNDEGIILTPVMMGTSYRTTPYNTRRAMNRFYQLRQSLKYLNDAMPNFLYVPENYF